MNDQAPIAGKQDRSLIRHDHCNPFRSEVLDPLLRVGCASEPHTKLLDPGLVSAA
jgi:hypothetical protein